MSLLILGAAGASIGLAAALFMRVDTHAGQFNSACAGAFGAWLGGQLPFSPTMRVLAAGTAAAFLALALNRFRRAHPGSFNQSNEID